jgi:hypothetical protein
MITDDVKVLVEGVSLLVLLVVVRVLMKPVRLLGLEAIIVFDQASGGHEHAYRRCESACRGSKCF